MHAAYQSPKPNAEAEPLSPDKSNHPNISEPLSLVTADSHSSNLPPASSSSFGFHDEKVLTTSTIKSQYDDAQPSLNRTPSISSAALSSSIDLDYHLRSAAFRQREQDPHEWHAFLSRHPAELNPDSFPRPPSPAPTPPSRSRSLTRPDAPQPEETLLSITANAIGHALFGTESHSFSDVDSFDIDQEVYNSFIRTLVDCVPLVKKDNQIVITCLLRKTAFILNVSTVTSWFEPQNQHTPSKLAEPLDDQLIRSVLLLGDGSNASSSSNIGSNRRWKKAKRRMLQRALLLAATPFYGRASSKTNDTLEIHVMLSYTLTLTTTLAAFSRFGCNCVVEQYTKDKSEFFVVGTYYAVKVAFVIAFQGDAPCTVTFYHPGIIAIRTVDKVWDLVTDVRGIVEGVERKVLMWECSRRSSMKKLNKNTPGICDTI